MFSNNHKSSARQNFSEAAISVARLYKDVMKIEEETTRTILNRVRHFVTIAAGPENARNVNDRVISVSTLMKFIEAQERNLSSSSSSSSSYSSSLTFSNQNQQQQQQNMNNSTPLQNQQNNNFTRNGNDDDDDDDQLLPSTTVPQRRNNHNRNCDDLLHEDNSNSSSSTTTTQLIYNNTNNNPNPTTSLEQKQKLRVAVFRGKSMRSVLQRKRQTSDIENDTIVLTERELLQELCDGLKENENDDDENQVDQNQLNLNGLTISSCSKVNTIRLSKQHRHDDDEQNQEQQQQQRKIKQKADPLPEF
jgi:hypothetical protein